MKLPIEIKEYMAKLGRKGRGKSKLRGDSEYYKKLASMRKKK